MSINEDICYETKKFHSCPCYFDALVTAEHAKITCHDKVMLIFEHWENKMVFSIRDKGACMIACNMHVAIQVVTLESFDCTHE